MSVRRPEPRRRHAWLWAWLVGVFALSWSASAHAQAVDGEVARRAKRAQTARGPEGYARIRELWRAWETSDPAQVEAALSGVARAGATPPPLKVYAGLLEAYARRRRGDLAGAVQQTANLGFVRRWFVAGPFDNENRPGLDEKMMPELELREPIVLDRSFTGKGRSVRWRRSPDVHRFGWLDFAALVRPHVNQCSFASTFVRSTRDKGARPLTVWVGAGGAFKVFWNDREVLADRAYRSLDADRFATAVTLEPGFNRLTVKVCNHAADPSLSLRLAEPDGSPARDVEVVASVAASTKAAARQRARGKTAKKRRGGRKAKPVLGPLQALQARQKANPTDPAALTALARYLAATGGDPEGQHTARDLIGRAARAEPNAERLLLAAALAEDRNGRRGWLDQAVTQVTTTDQRIALWLRQAQLARSGPNWQDAVPFYERVLRLDPHHVAATLGRVDLHQEAGLKRTALAALEAATRAKPRNVALLRALAAQLRGLGRDAEARQVESRYAALRFDDGGYIKSQIELAVARRDRAEMRRWSKRLLAVRPASSWAHGVVARAHKRLGERAAARRVYEAMLKIAPEDTPSLRALADLHGEGGRRAKQITLLRRILRIAPQSKGVRAYLEHIDPASARGDEKHAWPAERFLAERTLVKSSRHAKRTLRKLKVTTVYDNGLASRFHQVVFQPLTNEAAATARQFAFSYHSDRQVVELRAARVYRKDGRVDEAIESDSAPLHDPSINMYTLQRTFYVQFPRLNPGDVVELRYRVDDVAQLGELSGTFNEIEYLQDSEPIGQVEYILSAPKTKQLVVKASGLPGLKKTVTEQGGRRIHRFVGKAVPALVREPAMPPWSEVLAHVHVSSFKSWDEVGRWYWGLAKDKLHADDSLRALTKKLVADRKTAREKVAAVYRYAASETRYVALELGIEGIRPRGAALTLARGWGDCKDKATIIVSMLKEVGIDAELVLVRTGLRGLIDTSVASLAPFDHAIAYVPSLDLYLDGTAEGSGSGELPAMDRGAVALRIQPTGGKLVNVHQPPASASSEDWKVLLDVSKSGALRFDAKVSKSGVHAARWRRRFGDASTRRERAAKLFGQTLGAVAFEKGARGLKVSDLEALERSVDLHARGTASAALEGGVLRVPVAAGFQLQRSLASLPTRKHPLLVGARRVHSEKVVVTLAPGMTLAKPFAPVRVNSPFGSYTAEAKVEGQKVTVFAVLSLSRDRIAPSDYPAWRKFCEAVDAASGRRLLVKP